MLEISEDSSFVFVKITPALTRQGKLVVYSPSGALIWAGTYRKDAHTETLPRTLFSSSGNYCFFIYDLDNIVVDQNSECRVISPFVPPPSESKEYVIEFSDTLNPSGLVVTAIQKLVSLLGGKSSYVEGNKLIVVM